MSSDKIGRIILWTGLILITAFLVYSVTKRNNLLASSDVGYVKVLDVSKGRKGITSSAVYLKLLVILPDSSYSTNRKLSAGADISIGSCYPMNYSSFDIETFNVDYSSIVKCPESY